MKTLRQRGGERFSRDKLLDRCATREFSRLFFLSGIAGLTKLGGYFLGYTGFTGSR